MADDEYQLSDDEQKQLVDYKNRYHALSANIQELPDVAELYFQRGQLLLEWNYWYGYGDLPNDEELNEADGMADLDRAIELYPTNVDYIGARAKQYEGRRRYEQTIADYNLIATVQPNDTKYLLAKAHLYDFTLMNYPAAIATYTQVIELLERRLDAWEVSWKTETNWPQMQGNLASVYAARAMCYYQSKQYQQAIADYTTLIEHDARPPVPYERDVLAHHTYYVPRSWCYAALGQHGKAAADYAREEQISGKSREQESVSGTKKDAAEYEQEVRQHTATIEQMEQSQGRPMTSMQPNSLIGSIIGPMMNSLVGGELNDRLAAEYRARAKSYIGWGKYDEAAADYRRAVELAHFRPAYGDMIHAGNATAEAGRYGEAIEYYTQAIEALLDRLEHPERRAEQHQNTVSGMMGKMSEMFAQRFGNTDVAQRTNDMVQQSMGNMPAQSARYLSTVRMNYYPMLRTAYFNRAIIYSKLQRHAEALADYNHGIELDPGNAIAYNDRGNAYRGLSQYEQALIEYNHAIQLEPNNSKFYNNRGPTYGRLGRFDEAFADMRRAMQLSPNNPRILYNMAVVLGWAGQAGEALSYLKQTFAIDPSLRENARTSNDFDAIKASGPQFAAELRRLIDG